jgi:lipopolysaccharide transport system permease protein
MGYSNSLKAQILSRLRIPSRQGDSLLRIEPSSGWVSLKLLEVWRYRELLYFLTWRDIKVRYKQTALGASWAVLQPFLTMVVFTLFFGGLANIASDGIPYPIFSYAALVPWTFFANSINQAANSLIGSANLVTKVYFPRLIIPIATVLSGVIDFSLAFLVLIGMMLFYGIAPTVAILWLPAFLLLALATALGVGLLLSAINAQFRDVRYVVPFIVQFWLFISPVIYPASEISERWRSLYAVNPMVGVIEGFRWALLDTGAAPGATILVSAIVAIVVLTSGLFYFRRVERVFADLI